MARTLYMNDGSCEVVFGNPQEALQKVIYEHLGLDCERLFEELMLEIEDGQTGDDFEQIADGYLSMLRETLEGLNEALTLFDKPRLNKAKLQKQLEIVRDNVLKNI